MNESGKSSPWPLVAISFGYFMVILDATVVNVALPAIMRSLHSTTTSLQWIVDSYSLVFAALLLSAGALGDRRGAKGVFLAGIGLFTLSSLACGLAQSTAMLILARCFQGLGAALAVPASLSLLQTSYTDRAVRARAFGIWGGVAGIAAGAGPVVGGALVSSLGWQSVFFINVPIGVIGIVLASHFLSSAQRYRNGIDLAGQISGILCLSGITVALIEAGPMGWASPVVVTGFALFVLTGGIFILIEKHVRFPMLPLGLFCSVNFSTVAVIGLLINFAFYGELFVMSIYLQQLRGLTPLAAGVALLPQMGMAVIGSTLSGRVMVHTGPRFPMLFGLIVGGIGLFGLMSAGVHSSYGLLVVPLVAVGFGMSFTMPAATAAIMQAAPAGHEGIASGVLNSARQVGGVIGVALLGTLVIAHGSSFIQGLNVGMLIAGTAFLLGAILVLLLVEPGDIGTH